MYLLMSVLLVGFCDTAKAQETPITMKQVGDGVHCTVHLEKAGKLKSMIKNGSQITRLNVTGEVNTNDVDFMTSFPRLKTLDVCKTTIKGKIDESKLKTSPVLDTLYIPNPESNLFQEFDVSRRFWGIRSRYLVIDGIIFINERMSANSYPGVQGFPNNKGIPLNITGTLDLTDAVVVNSYFNKSEIQRVVFSSKLKEFSNYAFSDCEELVEMVFGQSKDLDIGYLPKSLKRIILPKGITFKNHPNYSKDVVILKKTPDLVLTLEVKKPGDLGRMLMSDQVPQIVKLKIIGTLSFSDMETIGRMISLEELDLSEAVVNETPADKTSKAELAMLQFQLANEGQYQKDGNREAYKLRSNMADKVEKAIEEEKSKPGSTICRLPDNAFVNLPFLKKLYLPATLAKIPSSKITESTFMEEIWCSKKTARDYNFQTDGVTIKLYE